MLSNTKIEFSIFTEFLETCHYEDTVLILINCIEKMEKNIKRSIPLSFLAEKIISLRIKVSDTFGSKTTLDRPPFEVMDLIYLYYFLKKNEFNRAILYFEKLDEDIRDIVPKPTYSWMYGEFEKVRT